MHRYAAAHGLVAKQLTGAAEGWLRTYAWPGNVRELSYLMERVTLLSSERLLTMDTLERLCLPPPPPAVHTTPAPADGADEPLDERARLIQTLDRTEGNVLQAARLLGLSRSAMRHRLRRYGIERPRRVQPPRSQSPAGVSARQAGGTPPGTPAAPLAPAPAWEEKLVALLAVDLTFPQRTGVEAVEYDPRTAASRWEQTLMEKVQGFGGVLLQHFASLFLIVFGMSQALEQIPQQAVQAALAIQQVVAEDQRRMGKEPVPEVRQAIHLGTLLVEGESCVPSAWFLAMGETSSVPVRLLGHAAPGDILVSPQVGQLIAGWYALQVRELSVATGHLGEAKALLQKLA